MRVFDWLSQADVRELIDRVPLAIVLASHDGTVEFVNKAFSERFHYAGFAPGKPAPAMPDSDADWQSIRLACDDGQVVDARARAIRIRDGNMLIVSESHRNGLQSELEELRSRIAELERLSSTDSLTGIWNRTHLDRIIDFELSRTLRFKQPITLILVDVDRFKDVNDQLGHQIGDSVLCELVDVLRAHVRPSDALFRWGGDELLILSSSTGYRAGETLAERLRSAVYRHQFDGAGSRTVSIGVAEYLAPESTQVWFARADDALYAAKNKGRNRVHVDMRGSSDHWLTDGGASVLQLIWQEAYQCGDTKIDQQHRQLFELGNAVIAAAITMPSDRGAFNKALDALLSHVAQHFAEEEVLLEQVGYSGLEAHRRAHASLLVRAGELKAAAEAGHVSLGGLVDYLANDVVARHIFTVDRDFFPLFGTPADDTTGDAIA